VLIVCHFCRHCRDVTSDICHGSMISSADCLWQLNHAHKSWPTLSIVWQPLYGYFPSNHTCMAATHQLCRPMDEQRDWWQTDRQLMVAIQTCFAIRASRGKTVTRLKPATVVYLLFVQCVCLCDGRQIRTSTQYNIRTRAHNKTLISKTSQLNDRDFLIRMLYKDSY